MTLETRVTSQMTMNGDMGSAYGGTVIEKPVSVKEAMELAGLNWTVDKKPICTATHDRIKVPGYFATVRSDNKAPIGIVKGRYVPLQNADAFSWIDDLLGDAAGSACITSAGVLHGGRFTWICVDLGGFEIVPGDEVRKHLLLMNSHDGGSNFSIELLPNRVACQNMLNFYSANGRNNPFTIRHTDGMKIKMAEVRTTINMAQKNFASAQTAFSEMHKTRITPEQSKRLVYDCLIGGGSKTQKALKMLDDGKFEKTPTWVAQEKVISQLIEVGPGAEYGHGNVWGTFNGVNGYLDHLKSIRSSTDGKVNLTDEDTGAVKAKNSDIRWTSKLVGHTANLKVQAFNACSDWCKLQG